MNILYNLIWTTKQFHGGGGIGECDWNLLPHIKRPHPKTSYQQYIVKNKRVLTDRIQGKMNEECKLVCQQLLWLPPLSRWNKILLNAFHLSIQHHLQTSNSLNGELELWNINDRRHRKKVWVMAELLTEILGIRLTINPGNCTHIHTPVVISVFWNGTKSSWVGFKFSLKHLTLSGRHWFYNIFLCLYSYIKTKLNN